MGPRTELRSARNHYGKGFLGLAVQTVPTLAFWTMALFNVFSVKVVKRFPFPTILLQAIDGAMCTALCLQVLCLQLLTSADLPRRKLLVMVAFARQSIRSAISLDSRMSTTASECVIVSILRWWLLSVGTRQSRRPSSHCV